MMQSFFREGAIAIWILGILAALLIPLPPFLLDLCLGIQFFFALWVLFLTLHVKSIKDLSSFPMLLLLSTLFRLVLNMASTRSILTRAEAGHFIDAFGHFVMRGDLLVGFILFSLITLVNFIVITKGAGRIAEIGARFALDSLPGKQLAIESDASSGLLNAADVRKARETLAEEASFHGAMDGASKFIRGDAIAALIITGVNLIGGLWIGLMRQGLSLDTCASTYLHLTIGEGLAAQLPALMISISAGLVVTKVSQEEMTHLISRQLLRDPKVLYGVALGMWMVGSLPKMPMLLFFGLGIAGVWLAFFLKGKEGKEKGELTKNGSQAGKKESVEHVEMIIGRSLLSQTERLRGALEVIRKKIALEWGVEVPSCVIIDDLSMEDENVLLRYRGRTFLCEKTTVLSSLLEKIKETLLHVLTEFVTRQHVKEKIERMRQQDQALVEEFHLCHAAISTLTRVLRNLLGEKVPIRNFAVILEAFVECCSKQSGTLDIDATVETIRQQLAHEISGHFVGQNKIAHAVVFDPKVEQFLQAAWNKDVAGGKLILRPVTVKKITQEVKNLLEKASVEGKKECILLTHPHARKSLKILVEKEFPQIPVLSFPEIYKDVKVSTIGMISDEVLV